MASVDCEMTLEFIPAGEAVIVALSTDRGEVLHVGSITLEDGDD
jgi:hypothetical protein